MQTPSFPPPRRHRPRRLRPRRPPARSPSTAPRRFFRLQQVFRKHAEGPRRCFVTISGTGSGMHQGAPRQARTAPCRAATSRTRKRRTSKAHALNPVKIPVALDAIIPVVSPRSASPPRSSCATWQGQELEGRAVPTLPSRGRPRLLLRHVRILRRHKTRVSSALSSSRAPAASFRPLPAIRTPLATSAWATSTAR